MPRNYVDQNKIDHDFGWLNSQEQNTDGYEKVSAHIAEDIAMSAKVALPEGFRLVRFHETSSSDSFGVALLSDVAKQIVYYIKCEIVPDVYLDEKPVTQVLLWRTGDVSYRSVTSGIAEAIFRNYLLDQYSIIASDNCQTREGRDFWVRQLGYALQYGEYVYRYNRIDSELIHITDHASIRDNSADLWGDDDSYLHILAVISKTELSMTS